MCGVVRTCCGEGVVMTECMVVMKKMEGCEVG